MPRKRPPLTPEQKEAKAARERERYQAAINVGFKPEQARSIKKTIEKMPELLQEPTEAVLDFLGMVKGAADWLLGTNKEKAGPDNQQGGRTSETSPKPAHKPRKDYGSFDDFVRGNPDLPANEIIRRYRADGGQIGNEKAKEHIRDVRGVDRQRGKVTRFHYYSNDDRPIFGGSKKLIKDRYMYLVQFEVELQDAADTKTDWLYVSSNRQLSMREIKEEALDMWADGYTEGREKYKALRIIPESIELIHAVDTSL